MSTNAKPYKETLNLPVTEFAMKANLPTREPQIQANWREQDLYGQLRTARKGSPVRVLHDGPPYANGDIHMGTALNKMLKDFVVRSLSMRGFDSPYVPGWDTHGLPIEHKVMKDLGSKAATLGRPEVREMCRVEAMKWVDVQRDQFRRLGVMGDWEDPYLTLDPRYEAGIVDVLADLLDGGFVFRQLKPIHWCTSDQTALAEAELEYHDETLPSIYVNFPMVAGVPADWLAFDGGSKPEDWRAMIWTTTPWTLPANVAIAAHPDLTYAGVRYTDPDTGATVRTILAADLVEKVMGLRKIADHVEVGRCKGRELEHAEYHHPFLERVSPIVLANYVSAEDGTGFVHTAPGHGGEDYQTGKAYQLPVLSPVDPAGRFTAEAPEWLVGQYVFAANPKVVANLKESGALYLEAPLTHSYPHCWRCKKPVIFRATEQWFVGVDRNDLRGRTLEQIRDAVKWYPEWGQARIEAMVSLRPDWCISRQRSWGVPIPALGCTSCNAQLLTAETARHFRDLFRKEGADAWFNKPVEEILPPGAKCSSCGGTSFRKEGDILDVWFESGSSHRAVLAGGFNLGFPAHMYLEGSDQHRGWFQSSILTAVGTTGKAPFESILTHGFVVDDKGQKMSKSLGNVVSAVKATEQHGADVLRLMVSSMDYADDVRISERSIKEASEAYRKIRNTFRYLLGNLEDYAHLDPATVDLATLHEIDRWALGQLNQVIRDAVSAYERFEFYRVYSRIYQFFSVELSSFYLDVLKDRLYAEAPRGPERRAAQYVLFRLHEALTRLLAPILPHTAEESWGYMPHGQGFPASVHLATFPQPDPRWDDPQRDARWAVLADARNAILKALEGLRKDKTIGSAQEASVTIAAPAADLAILQADRDLLATICLVSTIDVREGGSATPGPGEERFQVTAAKSTFGKCERCWNYREDVGGNAQHPTLCGRCVRVVSATAGGVS
ncbi:isoleucine--tRNA ligase [Paludisphaera rhizosphaerae]|uniref:isoleucine--tRNA ligase n=1 Tax=Paludisphaera rhizosphaerae TaxID=2711216 RepID=UPI0013EC39AA|nr:isoleucine--tRNA ligase [Paludisphaera rhizosphaerae]